MLAVHYKVDVLIAERIAEPIAGAQGHDVNDLVQGFVREIGWIVEALQRRLFLAATGGAP